MKRYPDHAGRMPDHPRYGNPSDPAEESARVGKAAQNLDDWAAKYGGEFSGGVRMQVGVGQAFDVQIGDREIAQKITGRPLPPPPSVTKLGLPPPLPPPAPAPQSWFTRLLNWFKGVITWLK